LTSHPPHSSFSLKKRVLVAGSWTLFGFGFALVLRLIGNLIIARLLAPEAFGIMAVCTAIHVIVALISDIGLRQAVIRSENAHDPSFLNTAWTVQILRSILIWIACIGAAFALYLLNRYDALPEGTVYRNAALPSLIIAVAFSTVIQGFQSMKAVVLGRGLDLRQNTIVDITTVVVGYLVAITVAWSTRSIWSFVFSGWTASAIGLLLSHLWLPGIRDRLAWNRKALRELANFGRWASASSIIGVMAMNGDRLLLGGWFSPTSLGFYSIASNLASVLDNIGSRVFASVSLPALSEIVRKQPDRLGEVFFRMRRWADVSYVGSAGLLFAVGQTLIATLYDARYLAAGHMLQLLSFGLLFSRYGLVQDAYIALGKPQYLAAINVTKVVSLFVTVPVMFYLLGPDGAIIGVAFYLFPTIPLILWLNHRHGLNNFKFEMLMLAVWPAGWLVGTALVAGWQWARLALGG
jgi:O-antigen/teichoic acid export membrane protein